MPLPQQLSADLFTYITNLPTPLRIVTGVTTLATLAVIDLYRNGRNATRWREYRFLAFCVAIALLYGALNDQISVTISWEYFYYGKNLSAVLGPDLPPGPRLRWEAAKVGMAATWSVGVLCGASLLIANNRFQRGPLKGAPPLSHARLALGLPAVLAVTIVCAGLGATAGYLGWLDGLDAELAELRRTNLWRPARFIAAWGEHLGAYVGGGLGLCLALARVVSARRSLRNAPPNPS